MSNEPSTNRPTARDRRQAARVCPGPLRAWLHRQCEGWLVDISERGALVRLPVAQTVNKRITLHLELPDQSLALPARVVRLAPEPVQPPGAVLKRPEHNVGVEFHDLESDARAALRRLVAQHQEEQQ
ncbi:MAG TPA: PilZ domain-containing protein [Vicinamibacterales bacterium]|nr:PilZ domain-containing protein [Vicinamibacterales bacterium]